MPRGNMPRQPSRSGRQEGARKMTKLNAARIEIPSKNANHGGHEGIRGKAAAKVVSAKAKAKREEQERLPRTNPRDRQRVQAIIEGLDKMYPGVTCALTHRNAWELLVATILSAQCTDVRSP